MGESPPFDPRAIANLLLDLAERKSLRISHVALQKLLFFAHARYLVDNKAPLVKGHFEAWQYGPVHPAVFKAFKGNGRQPINKRALATNIVSGETWVVPAPDFPPAIAAVERILDQLGNLDGNSLIKLSHAKNGPWHAVVSKSKVAFSFGMRIDDTVIQERFRNHWMVVGSASQTGEPHEDAPFA